MGRASERCAEKRARGSAPWRRESVIPHTYAGVPVKFRLGLEEGGRQSLGKCATLAAQPLRDRVDACTGRLVKQYLIQARLVAVTRWIMDGGRGRDRVRFASDESGPWHITLISM